MKISRPGNESWLYFFSSTLLLFLFKSKYGINDDSRAVEQEPEAGDGRRAEVEAEEQERQQLGDPGARGLEGDVGRDDAEEEEDDALTFEKS